ncbi:type IV secretory system conjugative DNA transfer family protein [Rhodococcus qingshengii]|uniref:type IV secretory system conjugative DNA transfer family protein n=1 Tax=Rhodococcus qingshengii TaxID=334542 RepID=UPI0029422DAF|nr:type IV secretion system DNA-binding domain-containing protein [Rhodococcus qingshengii]WOI86006.1 type IV secretion system DNA-binding domain-containing protein [Rhodococcus qingshengii]
MALVLLLTIATPPIFILWVVFKMKLGNQRQHDVNRQVYELSFPVDLDEARVIAWLRSIGGNLGNGLARLRGVPTVVFETIADGYGIKHRLHVPRAQAEFIMGQLRSHIPGVDFMQVEFVEPHVYTFGVEVSMNDPSRTLTIASNVDMSTRLLSSIQNVQEGERVVQQWVVSHTRRQKMPSTDEPVASTTFSIGRALLGITDAGRDEVTDRRQKQSEQNYAAVGRVAAIAANPVRAEKLVANVVLAVKSENNGTTYFKTKRIPSSRLGMDINDALTPLHMTTQLTISELTPLIAWPIGQPYVPGLNRHATRHLPATEAIPRIGRVLGHSTMPGNERPVAQSYRAATMHTFLAGGNGSGKTTLMVNTIRQDIERGSGVIIIEYDGDLLNRSLNHIPPERLDDLIMIDFASARQHVGLNLLDIDSPQNVANKLITLFETIYPDTRSINTRRILSHALPALGNVVGATVADIMPLVNPKTPRDAAWAREVDKKISDQQIAEFFRDWRKDKARSAKSLEPLENRIWEVMLPKESRNFFNQSHSSFQPDDVINGNKLLFVNLAGVPQQVASVIGSLLVSAIWDAARQHRPERENFMYIDEAQLFAHLDAEFIDMLATARKRNLGLVLATQYVERLGPQIQDAIAANARTKVIFQSGPKSASIHQRDFGDRLITPDHFQNLKAYTALARIMTEDGISAPVTIQTQPEPAGYGLTSQAIRLSNSKYGRTEAQILADEQARRTPPETTSKKAGPVVGLDPWDADE